jgi:hypothetical protein
MHSMQNNMAFSESADIGIGVSLFPLAEADESG